MAQPYIPEFVEEELEILMKECRWWEEEIINRPEEEVFVRYDEYLVDIAEAEERVDELDNDNWDLQRKVEELEDMYQAEQRRVAELEQELDQANMTIQDLVKQVEELENHIE